MDWYYGNAGQQIGPIDEVSFDALVGAGVIRDETLVWRPGLPAWQKYQTIRPAQPLPPPVITADGATVRYCSECGKPYPPDELAAFGTSLVCAACKPAFTQKLREGLQPAGAVRYAGFWIRFVAVIVDGIALYIVGMIFFAISMLFFKIDFSNIGRSQADLMQLLALEGAWALFNLIVSAIYEIWMVGRFGATLGKMACSLLVVNGDGSKVSYQRSLGRHFAKYLSSFILLIGYIMAGLDEEKRSLHDRICDTRVIKK
ncbi:MAG TPA: RDD family protein [Bryobacteraceae bacterium]